MGNYPGLGSNVMWLALTEIHITRELSIRGSHAEAKLYKEVLQAE